MTRRYSDDYTPEEGFVRFSMPMHRMGELESIDHGIPVSRLSEFHTGRTRDAHNMSIDELAKDIKENGLQNPVHVGFHSGLPALFNGNHRYLGAKAADLEDMPAAVSKAQHDAMMNWINR